MSETSNNARDPKRCFVRVLRGRRFAIVAGTTALVFLVIWVLYTFCGPLSVRNRCAANLRALGKAMVNYAGDYDEKYPSADKWCDMLIEYMRTNKHVDLTEKNFYCPANKKTRCSYAINPNASPRSHPRLVLLFEAKGGWNQFGGPEMLSTENHGADGCNILFCDLHVEWVTSNHFNSLKWTSD